MMRTISKKIIARLLLIVPVFIFACAGSNPANVTFKFSQDGRQVSFTGTDKIISFYVPAEFGDFILSSVSTQLGVAYLATITPNGENNKGLTNSVSLAVTDGTGFNDYVAHINKMNTVCPGKSSLTTVTDEKVAGYTSRSFIATCSGLKGGVSTLAYSRVIKDGRNTIIISRYLSTNATKPFSQLKQNGYKDFYQAVAPVTIKPVSGKE